MARWCVPAAAAAAAPVFCGPTRSFHMPDAFDCVWNPVLDPPLVAPRKSDWTVRLLSVRWQVLTADHGNCEKMWEEATDEPHTAHTLNKVPMILVSDSRIPPPDPPTTPLFSPRGLGGGGLMTVVMVAVGILFVRLASFAPPLPFLDGRPTSPGRATSTKSAPAGSPTSPRLSSPCSACRSRPR